nr:thiamine pyrophosphate-binding protein [Aminobacter sp. MSH1]
MNGADVIVGHLKNVGMPYIFGVCGHGNVGFLDSVHKASDDIKFISVHHEQTAGFMADAYYKVRHEPVATLTSCGPGSTNLVISLAAAMADSSAFLAITANVPTGQFNRNPFQETGHHFQGDFPSVIKPYVKRSYQPTRVDMVPLAVKQACQQLTAGRPGPVNLDVPLNVFVEEDEVSAPLADARINSRSSGNPALLSEALSLLLNAGRPVIVAGQGVLLGEATDALKELAELLQIPVVTSPNGKGAISERHPLCFGTIGRNGTYSANEATKAADVVLSIGFSFDDRATSSWIDGYTFSIPKTKLIQIDIDPTELGRNYPPHLGILGDAGASLDVMIAKARAQISSAPQSTRGWLQKLEKDRDLWRRYQGSFAKSNQVPLRPERLMDGLARSLPDNAILASDVGVHHNWVVQLWDTIRPRQLLQSWGFAAMGYATSGILGAKLAAPDRPCVCVAGDGSFLMTPHVLATAREYNIPVVWVVWNNYAYGSIRDLQHGLFGGRELGTSFETVPDGDLYNPDFCALAASFGVDSIKVTEADQVEDAILHAIAANRPFLVEVPVDRDIRPVGSGTWALPPLPHHEPNFLAQARALGLL